VARKLHIGGVAKEAPRLSLPGKLVFPSIHSGRFSMLGLGDIVSSHLIFFLSIYKCSCLLLQVMPGLLLCFVMRYDAYKKSQLLHFGETGVPPPRHLSKIRLRVTIKICNNYVKYSFCLTILTLSLAVTSIVH